MILQIKDQLAELNEEVCRRDKDAHVPLGNIDMKEFDKKNPQILEICWLTLLSSMY